MNYFVYNNLKIFVEFIDSNIILYKYINGVLNEIIGEEKTEILDIFSNKNGYIVNSEKLMKIIESNSSLSVDKNYYYRFLSCIETIIPVEYRSNFYNNLKTLQVDLNFFEEVKIKDDASRVVCGTYNGITNKVTITPENINYLKSLSKDKDNSQKVFWDNFNRDLIHELLHMASSSYDKEGKIYKTGLYKYPANNVLESSLALNEGLTEVMATSIIENPNDYICEYYFEELFVKQMICIIGANVFIKSYFGNFGCKLIAEQLYKIDNDYKKINDLFCLINCNYQIRREYTKQTFLGSIQKILVEYFSKKILMDIKRGVKEDIIRKLMNNYKKYLITESVLNQKGRYINNYPNLNDSVNLFLELEKEVEEKLKENNWKR